MKIRQFFTVLMAAGLSFNIACREDEPVAEVPKGAYENGIFIANEGNFGSPNAGVTFVSKDLATIENGIYAKNNGNAPLGDVLQTIGFNGDQAYFVMNASNKIVVANRYTMKKEGEITAEINQPRYIAFANNQAYVTNDGYGAAKFLSIYKTSDRSFVKKINFTDAAERVVEAGRRIFVQHASFGSGNKISIVETSGNTVAETITVPVGDITKIISHNGSVYALAKNAADSYIYEIAASGVVRRTITLKGIANANNLEIEGNDLYFSSGNKIYRMAMTAVDAPATALITVADNSWSTLYGMNVVDGKIFTSDANGFTADSKISVYSLSGSLLKTFEAGRSANGFYAN